MKMHVEAGKTLNSLMETQDKKYICGKVNGRVKELTYVFDKDGDYDIQFLDLTHPEATRIYSTSIRYLFSMAVKILFPKADFRFFYNISRSLFAKVVAPRSFKMNPATVSLIETKMRELVSKDIPLNRIRVTKETAIQNYKSLGLKDKIQVLKYRPENYVHLYEAKTKEIDYFDYLYEYMVPSTGYLGQFITRYYAPGIIIQVPRSECDGKIPEFLDETKFATALQTTSHWAEENNLDTVGEINAFVKSYSSLGLINICEARMNNMLAEVGNIITSKDEPIRLICVAGPSSSGKTSFANRLVYELMAHGLRPIRISMDDYFIPLDQLDKNVSLESVNALDIELFNGQMDQLIRGESVILPTYDFKDHTRKPGKKTTLLPNQPIIIEGIHALNSKICSNIHEDQKFRIYIAPQPQVNIDDHSPISMTDMRLLRRIARDSRTRNTDAAKTIRMWPSVRAGEFTYIYPTQENADYVFDSFLAYELCALRNIVLPQLEKIKPDQDEYLTASRLRAMVKYFIPIGLSEIPCNSIMREFVGGSAFKDAR